MNYDWLLMEYGRMRAELAFEVANLEGYERQMAPGIPMTRMVAESIRQCRDRIERLHSQIANLERSVPGGLASR